MKRTVLFSLLAVSCGGTPLPPATATTEVVVAPPPPPTYVVVHRNTQLHLEPRADSPFVQYRTPQQQADFDAAQQKAAQARATKEADAAKKRADNAKKRRERLRKRWQRVAKKRRAELWEGERERIAANKVRDAERTLASIRKRAQASRLEAPDKAWIPMRLVSNDGSWAQVTLPTQDQERPHCYRENFGVLDNIDATYWVRADQLGAVTTKSVTIAPQQGTQVILRPGVAMLPAGEAYDVYIDGFVLRLDVPANAIGTEYEPGRPFEAPMTDSVFTAQALAGNDLVLGPGQPLPYNPFHPLFITGTLWVGSIFYATTQTPCAEYTVRAKEEHVEHAGRRGAMRLMDETEKVRVANARAGAAAFFPSSEEFGQLRGKVPLGEPTSEAGGRSCYNVAVWGAASEASVELCFAPEDVEHPEE